MLKGKREKKEECGFECVWLARSELSSETITIKAQLLHGEADTHAQNNVRARDGNAGSSGL